MSNELAKTNEYTEGVSIFTNAKLFGEIGTIAKVLAESSVIPIEYQKNIPNVLIALEMAIRLKTSPVQVMQNLYVVNGRPSWSSPYIAGVINASGRYKHELKFELSGKGESLACYAWTTTKDGDRLEGPIITWEMANAEGWTTRNGSKWKTMPEVMIRYRAASFFGRLYCNDLIMGIYAEEETAAMPLFDTVDCAEREAREEIAANANSIPIEPPKSDAPAEAPSIVEDAPAEPVETKQREIDF
jgi:hypothetical protein